MPRVAFASAFRRFVACPDEDVDGADVATALAAYFSRHAGVRGYVLDDQGHVRQHVAVFVDGAPIRDRRQLGDAVAPASEVLVLQALSGG